MAQLSAEKLDQQIAILKRRTGQRWTIREIAKETGISSTYLTFLKNGHRKNPSYDVVKKLSEFFHVEPESLLQSVEEASVSEEPERTRETAQPFTRQTLEFCQQLLQTNHPEQVIQFLSLFEETSATSGHVDLYVEKQLTKANAYLQLGKHELSLAILEQCLAHGLSDSLSEKTKLLLHEALGHRCKSRGEYGLAIYHIEQSLRHFPDQEASKKKAAVYLELGKLHLQVMSFTAAAQALAAAEKINRVVQDPVLLGDLPYWRAKVEYYAYNYVQAQQLLQTSLQVRQTRGDYAGVAACLLDLAACCQKLGCWETVKHCAERAAISYENMNEHGLVARAKLLLVEAQHHLNADRRLLLDMIEPVCQLLSELDWRFELATALGIKADLCRHLGDDAEALEASMKALTLFHSYEGERAYV